MIINVGYDICVSKSEDGQGYIAFVPDLPGCMADGRTPGEAKLNACDAAIEWLDEAKRLGRHIPAPQS